MIRPSRHTAFPGLSLLVAIALFSGCDSGPGTVQPRANTGDAEAAAETGVAKVAVGAEDSSAATDDGLESPEETTAPPASAGGEEEPRAPSGSSGTGEQPAERAAAAAQTTADSAAAESSTTEWPMWGGKPWRNMVNTVDRGIPHDFDVETGKHVKWSAKLGSQTYGNPVLGNGKVLVGTNNQLERNPEIKGDKGVIMCFDTETGEFLYQAVHDKLASGRVNDWPEQGICSTPAIEGNRFYYVSNRAELVCADLEGFLDGENDGPFTDEKYSSKIDGDFIWVLDMMNELGVFPHNLATSSPVIGGNLVFILTSNGVDEGHIDIPAPDAPSFLAVDKSTGKVAWEDASPGDNILHGQWSSPAYGDVGGESQVIFPGGDGWLYGFEPTAGKLRWKFDCNPKDSKWELGGRGTRNSLISTPVIHDGKVYIAVGQDPEHGEGPGHLWAIDPAGKSGDITESGKIWHFGDRDFNRSISTVSIHDGLLYAVDLSGFLNCLDVETGEPYWVHDTLAAVWSSPMFVDGKVFLGDEDGDLLILEAGKQTPRVLAEPNLGNSVYSTVTVAGGVMYISNRTTLFAIAR